MQHAPWGGTIVPILADLASPDSSHPLGMTQPLFVCWEPTALQTFMSAQLSAPSILEGSLPVDAAIVAAFVSPTSSGHRPQLRGPHLRETSLPDHRQVDR